MTSSAIAIRTIDGTVEKTISEGRRSLFPRVNTYHPDTLVLTEDDGIRVPEDGDGREDLDFLADGSGAAAPIEAAERACIPAGAGRLRGHEEMVRFGRSILITSSEMNEALGRLNRACAQAGGAL